MIVTGVPAVTTPDGVVCTVTAGHTVRYVVAENGGLTSIVAVGVPVTLMAGPEQAKGAPPWVKVHGLMLWPLLSVT